ncbi:MAG: DUF1990 family protein, partial [Acidimicrobiia bacterium]|nr:DUF1990 family protein [Acidimicrobiia bacterium]
AGTFRFLSRRSIRTPMVAMDMGLMMIGFAGIALTLDHVGIGAFSGVRLSSVAFLVPVIAAECVRDRAGRWWIAAGLAIAVPGGAVSILLGDTARLAGFAVIALAAATAAVLSIRIGTEQTATAQIALLSGGAAVGLGAGLLLAAEAFAFFDVTGEALDLLRRFDWPLVAFGLIPILLGLVFIPRESPPGQRRTFFHLGPPTPEQLSRLSQELEQQELKAALNPLDEAPPAGYRAHRITRPVPNFEDSCEALWTWAGHEAAGIELTPEQPPFLMGKDVVFAVPVGPFTITSTGRILALISDENHYGFVHSTLDHHPLVGTEAIILDKSAGSPTLTIATVWRPNCVAAHLMRPVANQVLDRIVGRYLDGIAEAETAAVGSRMMDLVSDVSKRRYEVSRESIRAEAPHRFPSTTDVHEDEVVAQPLDEFEALFEQPLHAPSDEIEILSESEPHPAE